MKYSNSFVDFLNPNLKDQIFKEHPNEPFNKLQKLREKEKFGFYKDLNDFGDSFKNLYNKFENLLTALTPSIYLVEDMNLLNLDISNLQQRLENKYKIISIA